MKLLGVIRDNNFLEYLDNGLDGIVLPLENFSVDYFKYYSISDIKEYKKSTDKLLYVVINKMIFNNELDVLLNILKELENIKVDGIFFYDLAVLNLVRENSLNLNLIYNGTHMVTNSDTINLYYDLGVKGAYLSNEITKDEVINIRNNTKSDLFILLLGNPVAAMSRRSLLTSYFANKNKSKNEIITIKEPKSGQEFLVKEDNNGTTFFYNNAFSPVFRESLRDIFIRGYIYVNTRFYANHIFCHKAARQSAPQSRNPHCAPALR